MAAAKRPNPSSFSSSSTSTSTAYKKRRLKQQAKEKELLLLLPQFNEEEEEEEEEEVSSSREHIATDDDDDGLLPGLPDHLSQLCLSTLPPRLLFSVCHSWRRLLYSPSFPPFLSLYALLHDHTTSFPISPPPNTNTNTTIISFSSFDPISGRWVSLPPPPLPNPPPLIHHPSFLSRRLPMQSVSASGRLVLVAGSTRSLLPALARPLVFDPSASPCTRWQLGQPFPFSPRRWCAAGSARGHVFLAGGVGSCYDAAIARSAACWEPSSSSSIWKHLAPLRDGRFTREAVEAVCSNGKVCMVNLRGHGAKEGAVYDLNSNKWENMSPAMLAGWTGPAAAADNDDEEDAIYVVDEASGALRVYDWRAPRWKTLMEPNERLKGATEMTAGGGKVCVVINGGEAVVVIDVKKTMMMKSRRMWIVEAPAGKRVVSVHVLPRMCLHH